MAGPARPSLGQGPHADGPLDLSPDRDQPASWLRHVRALACVAATCRALRAVVQEEPGLWQELVLSPSYAGLPAQSLPALQRFIERHASWAVRLSVFHDPPTAEHVYQATAAASNITTLDLHHVCQPSTVEELSQALAASSAQLRAARFSLCAVAAQLPSSVERLEVEPVHDTTGWAFYQKLQLTGFGRLACASWLLHRSRVTTATAGSAVRLSCTAHLLM